MENTQLKNTIDKIRNILRSNGIVAVDSIYSCITFFLLRRMTAEKCKQLDIPEKFCFDNFCKEKNKLKLFKNQDDIEDCFYYYLINNFNLQNLSFMLSSEEDFDKIIQLMKDLDISNLDQKYDIVGTIFELHMQTGSTNRDLAQFFSPRIVIQYIFDQIKPKINKEGLIPKVCDVSGGSGGMVSMYLRHVLKNKKDIDWSINKDRIHCYDLDEIINQLSKTNIFIESGQLFQKNICTRNSLYHDWNEKFDLLLNNPPFSVEVDYDKCCELIRQLKIKSTKAELLFLQLNCQLLNDGGICAIILHQGVFFGQGKQYIETRKNLIDNFFVYKVINMKGENFINTSVQCSMIIFQKIKKENYSVVFSEILQDGVDYKENILQKIEVDQIKKNNYNLNYEQYDLQKKDDLIEGIEYEKLGNICQFNPQKKYDTSCGKKQGKYPFYTGGLGQQLYTDKNDFKTNGSGKCNIFIDNQGQVATQTITFNALSDLKTNYLFYFLKNHINILEEGYIGAVHKNISLQFIQKIKVPKLTKEQQRQFCYYYQQTEQIQQNNQTIENFQDLIKMNYQAQNQKIKLKDLYGKNSKFLVIDDESVQIKKQKKEDVICLQFKNENTLKYVYYYFLTNELGDDFDNIEINVPENNNLDQVVEQIEYFWEQSELIEEENNMIKKKLQKIKDDQLMSQLLK